MSEKWESLIDTDFAGLYEVSDLGRVRRSSTKRVRVLKVERDGYETVCLSNRGFTKHRKVHRLVAQTFLVSVPNKTQVNHKNGVKADNQAENLEWCTSSENRKHGIKLGTIVPAKGVQFNRKGLNEEDIRKIRTTSGRLEDVGKMFGISRGMVWLIKTRKSWKHVT